MIPGTKPFVQWSLRLRAGIAPVCSFSQQTTRLEKSAGVGMKYRKTLHGLLGVHTYQELPLLFRNL